MPNSTPPRPVESPSPHETVTLEPKNFEFDRSIEQSSTLFAINGGTCQRYLTPLSLSEDSFFVEDFYRFNLSTQPRDFLIENNLKGSSLPVLSISIVYKGGYKIHAPNTQKVIEINPDISQFSHLTNCNFERIGPNDSCLHVCNLSIPINRVKAWLGESETDSLLSALKITSLDSSNGFKVPRSISNILKFCVDYRLSEKLRALQLQARLFDYFVALYTYLNSTLVSSAWSRNTQSRARAVHDYLLNINGKTPTLSVLANRFGVSPAKLNSEFFAHYHQSIFTFLTSYRLEQARLAIETSSHPIKKISHLSGYSHVSHFTAAFKRKFGCTPGALRSSKRSLANPSQPITSCN